MKRQVIVVLVLVLCVVFAACGHTHTWQEADCVSPATCTDCGETEGEALGHAWTEATCTAPKSCEICGETEGEALEHEWTPATCVEAETCSVCGETRGEPLGHTVEAWEVVSDSTCTEEGTETGTCTTCGELCEQQINLKEHEAGEWEVQTQPTADSPGTRVKNCTVCGTEVESEEFTLTEEEIAQLYKDGCQSIAYDSLARTPGEYEGERVKFSGYVVQVCSEAQSELYYSAYRVATSGRYDNVVFVKVDNYGSGTRILEDDYITFYGEFDGLYSYETVMGATMTIPSVLAEYVE